MLLEMFFFLRSFLNVFSTAFLCKFRLLFACFELQLCYADYSWEYEGHKYTFKEKNLKTYEAAEEFCRSQGGWLPNFKKSTFNMKKSVQITFT